MFKEIGTNCSGVIEKKCPIMGSTNGLEKAGLDYFLDPSSWTVYLALCNPAIRDCLVLWIGFTHLGSKVGIHATLEKADICGELIRASSDTPPDLDRGPTASTRHRISSLQNP